MAAHEEQEIRADESEHSEPLQHQLTGVSEKTEEEYKLEKLKSIASSLHGTPDQERDVVNDIEKAPTRASRASGEPVRKIKTAADWDGPDDPGNPLNWPLWKRGYHTAATGVLAFAITCGSSLISPATEEIAVHFGVSVTAAIVPLTVYVVGLGFGPIIAAPISETMGRNVVYKVTPPIFMLFLIGSGFSTSIGSLIVCRLLAGLAGSPVLAVGAGTSADMYPIQNRAIASTLFVMMPFMGPSVGPVIGGFASYYKGWRWTQWCSIFIGVVAYIMVLPMQETYKKIILTRRAKKLGIPGPPKPKMTPAQTAKLLLTVTLFRPILMLLTEPMVLFLSVYNAFTFAVLFALFAAYPYVFEGVYGFNTWQSSLPFIGVLIGVLLAVVTVFIIDRKVYYKKFYRRAIEEGKTAVAPEHRLYAAMIGSFCIPIGLFWFGWTSRHSVHWIVPTLAGIPFAYGNTMIFVSAALYLIDVYGGLNGASALAANGILRYNIAGVFPLFTIQMYSTLGIGWASSLLGFISVLMMPIPWVFYKYGTKLREKSSYDTVKF